MNNLRATLTTPTTKTAMQPTVPMTRAYSVVGTVQGELRELVCVRVYQGSGATVRACIWLQVGEYRSGRGSAGGYGYDKASAAVQEALSNAGIQLWGTPYGSGTPGYKRQACIAGVGESAIESALLAIGKMLAPRSKLLVVRN